jgi:hypothetical protein
MLTHFVAMYEIPCSCSGAGADQCALLASDKRATDRSNSRSDRDVFSPAVRMAIWTTMCKRSRKGTENQEDNHQQNSQHALFPVTLYHFHSPHDQM